MQERTGESFEYNNDSETNLAIDILNHIPFVVAILDAEGLIKFISPAVYQFIGYHPDELIGTTAFSLLFNIPDGRSKARFGDLKNNYGIFIEGLLQLRHKNGKKISADVSVSNLLKQSGIRGILLDMRPFRKSFQTGFEIPLSSLNNEIVKIEIEAREKAQQQIAADLHDHINPTLLSVKLLLDYSIREMSVENMDLKKISETVGILINDIRNLSRFFSFERIDGFELSEGISMLIESFRKSKKIRLVVKYDKGIDNLLHYDQKIHVFRIIQEQLANIVKHSQAEKVYISLKYSQGIIKVITRDNGLGFEINNRRHGIGLSNMVYRVNILKGNIQISSAKNAGTSIQIQFPID